MKVKETVKKMGEKTEKFYEENKVFVGYMIGIVVSAAFFFVWTNAKSGSFQIGHAIDPENPNDIRIRVRNKNRFGVVYDDTDHLLPLEKAIKMEQILMKEISARQEILEGKEN